LTQVSIITALVAGVLSFVSPCVLPLIPAYISYISGASLQEIQAGEVSSKKIIVNSIAFVLGFSTVFVLLGASASLIGRVLARHMNTFKLIAGIIIIIFGLHTAGIMRIKFLNYEKKVQVKRSNSATLIGAYVIGIAFAAGWTPCVGPILGAILATASTYTTMWKGILLLAIYSLGLGIPFILTAWAINKFFVAFKQIRKYFHAIEVISGILLIIVGLLLIFMKGLHF